MTDQHVQPQDVGAPLAIDRLLRPIRNVFRYAAVAMLVLMLVLPALQVVLRQIFQAPFIGSEELTRFMLIGVVFTALPYVVASGTNIRMEEVLLMLSERTRSLFAAVISLTAVLGFGIAGLAVMVATLANLDNATPTLGIPYWIFFSAALFGFVLAAVESAVQLWKALKGHPPYVRFSDEISDEPEPHIA